MLIEIKKKDNYKPLIFLRESKIKSLADNILLEAAHAFDEQYSWAKKCAEILYYEFISKGKTEAKLTFDNPKDTSIKGIIANITTNNLLKTSASLTNLTSDGYVKLNLNVNRDIMSNFRRDAINEIWDAIVHELGHANIYWRKYTNKQNINDTPDDYNKLVMVIQDENISPDDIAYLFCYALYSTYYHEIQAFVSQTYSDLIKNINKLYGKGENISKEQFWKALINTNTYLAYHSNIETSKYLLDSEEARKILINKLYNFGIFYTDKEIKKKCKEILDKSNDALKCGYNNAYQWFYKKFKSK